MSYKVGIISVWLVLLLCIDTRGQAARTPFSAFGFGRHYNNALAYNQGMGGIGMGTPSYLHFNAQNPALLVFNQLTVIEAGFVGEQRWLTDGKQSDRSGGISFNYFAMGFPIKTGKWTTGIGLYPYTHIKYELHYTTPIEASVDSADVEESKEGGLKELYWSNGVALTKNLSIGLKASYFFGTIVSQYGVSLANSNQVIKYTSSIYERQSFSGFGLSAGLSFHLDSLFGKKRYRFNAGVVYSTGANMRTSLDKNVEQRNAISVTDSATTLASGLRGTATYPHSISGGISLSNGRRWLVGVDFSYSNFSQFNGFDEKDVIAQDGWKVALGGQFSPKEGTGENYFRLMSYQMGISFEKIPHIVNKNGTNDLGLSIGISLPIRNVSSINLVAKVGKQGDLVLNAIEEVYCKLYCGITFSDQWFVRRKFD